MNFAHGGIGYQARSKNNNNSKHRTKFPIIKSLVPVSTSLFNGFISGVTVVANAGKISQVHINNAQPYIGNLVLASAV